MNSNIGTEIRRRRKEQKLSLKEMSRLTGLTESFLSQVERGKCSLSLMSMQQVAKALGVEISDLFGMEPHRDPVDDDWDAKRRDHMVTKNVGGGRFFETLTDKRPDRSFDVVRVTCAPHTRTETSIHEGEEFVYVLEGGMHLTLDGVTKFYKKGEYAHYLSTTPHALENRQDTDLKYLITITELID